MDNKLQKKLFKKYPKLFKQKNLSMKETAMCWGIDTGNGWFWLIDNVCERIQNMIDWNKGLYKQLEFVQVKEKFGGLRMYTSNSCDYFEGVIDFASYLSTKICENCGSIDNVTQNTKGWVQPLCDKCRKKVYEEKYG